MTEDKSFQIVDTIVELLSRIFTHAVPVRQALAKIEKARQELISEDLREHRFCRVRLDDFDPPTWRVNKNVSPSLDWGHLRQSELYNPAQMHLAGSCACGGVDNRRLFWCQTEIFPGAINQVYVYAPRLKWEDSPRDMGKIVFPKLHHNRVRKSEEERVRERAEEVQIEIDEEGFEVLEEYNLHLHWCPHIGSQWKNYVRLWNRWSLYPSILRVALMPLLVLGISYYYI